MSKKLRDIDSPDILHAKIQTELLPEARTFFQHWDKINALRKELSVEDDVLLDPLHFLASTDDIRRSCSVACWREGQLIGLLYATQRYVQGLRTGYVLGGDYSGRGLLLCSEADEAAVVEASIKRMLAEGIHSLHLRMMPRAEEKTELPSTRALHLDAVIPGDRMKLPPSFDEFLGQLGKHTRRNIRYYTRKTFAVGIEFVPSLSVEEYEVGVARLNAETDFPAEPRRLARDRRQMALHAGGQRFGLRGPQGDLVAVLCGFADGGRFHVMTQLNDIHFGSLSLSTVLRGCTIEWLIGGGYTELQFMGGSSLSLGQFCIPQRYRSLIVDKKRGFAAAMKRLGSYVVKLAERVGRPLPSEVQTLCRGFLEEANMTKTTALGPASLAFGRESSKEAVS